MKLSEAKRKLAACREMCPGMSEHTYALTDYLAENVQQDSTPEGLMLFLVLALYDIERGRTDVESRQLSESLVKNKQEVLKDARYVQLVVDEIADKEFAEEFRTLCKELLGYDTRKKEKAEPVTKSMEEYAKSISAAAQWWTNIIMNPPKEKSITSEEHIGRILNGGNAITKIQGMIFKNALEDEIRENLKTEDVCIISVEYQPCDMLEKAAKSIGMKNTQFPWKTKMIVQKDMVLVSSPSGTDIIWRK